MKLNQSCALVAADKIQSQVSTRLHYTELAHTFTLLLFSFTLPTEIKTWN